MSETSPRVVAIDGPSGSGKSTVARGVAQALDLPVLDTGAIYRSVTLAVLESGVDPDDPKGCAEVAEQARVELEDGSVALDGRDVSGPIRGPEVTAAVSAVSAHPRVREVLVARQRAWVYRHGGGVVEGRDIGTVVFPHATLKVFVTASDEERARRRRLDEEAAGREGAVEEVQVSMARRDALDAGRTASPTAVADDAVVIDTTDRSVEEVVEEIVGRVQRAAAERA
ncbi:MAG: (d)CMP kinase [Actinobacteria bacterium]|nr:(d)CMP kinase [Actinomycetota bacterium]